MSTVGPLTFHTMETWRIDFAARTYDGAALPLPSGSIAALRIATGASATLLTCSSEDASGVEITDALKGLGSVTITPAMQTAAHIGPGTAYRFELRVETPDLVSVQAEGRLSVLPSLFATP